MKKFIIVICLLLAGCAPKLYKPQENMPERYFNAGEFPQDTIAYNTEWWKIFGDTTLDSLIVKALDNNMNLAQAASRVEAARLNLSVARSQFLPSVAFGISGECQYTTGTDVQQAYSVQPSVSWDISLFGALKNSTKSAKSAILSTEWAFRGVMLSLTAEVATTYFTLLQYRQDLKISEESYHLRSESAALIDSMFRYGMDDGVALQQARSLEYSAKTDIEQYKRAAELARLSLYILLGENPQPADTTAIQNTLTTDNLPPEIPIGLPSDLLYRRPDVMEAYHNMQKASADVGVARAARFPSIALTGQGGIFGLSMKDLTSGNTWTWSAALNIAQPIFAFGKLKKQELIAKENYNQTMFAYRQSVFQALSDVESALVSISTYGVQADGFRKLVDANNEIAIMTQALYKSGLSDYLNVIDAQRELYSSQMEYVNAITQQYINYVSLCKAIGGGW